jgi:hypothetical protein
MKIQIVSLPRTGSSYIRTLLNYKIHSARYDYDADVNEPFNDENYWNLSKRKKSYALSKIKEISKKNNIIIKNHYFHLYHLYQDYPELYFKFSQNNFVNYCLLRQNVFESALSTAIAINKNSWSYPYLYTEIDSIYIPFREFLNTLEFYKKNWLLVAENTLKINFKKIIYYENFTFDYLSDYNYITDSTETQYAETTDLSEISKKTPSKKLIVENYDQLKEKSLDFISNITHNNIINKNGFLSLNE